MFNYDLHKLTPSRGLDIVFIIFGVIIAPFWFLFQFTPNLFEKTDLMRLLLLSAAVGFPILVFNAFVLFLNESHNQNIKFKAGKIEKMELGDNDLYAILSIGSFLNMVVLYTPCILVFYHKMNLREAIISSFVCASILFAFISARILWGDYKSDSKKIMVEPIESVEVKEK